MPARLPEPFLIPGLPRLPELLQRGVIVDPSAQVGAADLVQRVLGRLDRLLEVPAFGQLPRADTAD